MSEAKAQARLEKLRSRLKEEERAKKERISKSSVSQTKRNKVNILGSAEKQQKIAQELLRQTRTESKILPSSSTASSLSPATAAPTELQKRGSAQSRLKRVVQASKKKPDAPKRPENVCKNPTQSSDQTPQPKTQILPQARPQAVQHQPNVTSIQGQPESLKNYKIPKTSASARLSQVSNKRSKRDYSSVDHIGEVVPCATTSRPQAEPRIPAKGAIMNTRNNKIRATDQMPAASATNSLRPSLKQSSHQIQPLKAAHIVKQAKLECHNKSQPSTANETSTQKYNPQLQRNLFKRKAPGEANVRATSEGSTNTLQQRDEQPDDTGGVKQFISKVAKGVMGALKLTWMSGAERLSSYSSNRSEVSKELQNVRTLVEQVELMDYEISCPSFEEDQGMLVQTDLHLVVDTNVIIDNMSLIQSLKGRKVKGMTPKIIVPWQVLKELDYLKEHKQKVDAVHRNARKGIRFLLDEIIQNSGFISGQPQHVASRNEDFAVEIPDDHLIKCCLQLKWSGHSVALLTNDKNLVLKAVVTEVPAMQSNELSKLLNESGPPCSLTCFESPPSGSFPQDQLVLANASHQLTVLLKNFLSAVMKKYLTLKYQSLWMLKSPGPEPWPLTTLLERAFEFWNEVTGKKLDSGTKDTILHLRRFINKATYERVRYHEVDQFARSCHQLAGSLPSTFGTEGVSFDNRLMMPGSPPNFTVTRTFNSYGLYIFLIHWFQSFWKCPDGSEPPADVTFIGSCVSLTIHHFQLFENRVVQYCHGLSQKVGVPFSYPKPCQELFSPVNVNLNLLPRHLSAVESIGSALERVSAVSIEEVSKSTEAVQTIHRTLMSHLQDSADPRFFVDDVLEFCRDGSMRQSIPSALNNLQILQSFLVMISQR